MTLWDVLRNRTLVPLTHRERRSLLCKPCFSPYIDSFFCNAKSHSEAHNQQERQLMFDLTLLLLNANKGQMD